MSAPAEDSQMMSSPDDSDNEAVTTPQAQTSNAQEILSPPDSQHRDTRNVSNSGSSVANSNGKRPIQTISNGNEEIEELAMMTNGKARAELPVKTHPSSGYTWTKAEDEPGYQWLNKKALDEGNRAWESLQHRDIMIKNRYGDPFEAAEKEQAIIASMKQQ